MECHHRGSWSGAARYLKERHQLRLVVVCDRCGAVLRELDRFPYRPAARLLYAHLVELTARELGLHPARVAALRMVALTGQGGEATALVEGLEQQVLALCWARLHSPAKARRRYPRPLREAFARAWQEHDRRLDRAAA